MIITRFGRDLPDHVPRLCTPVGRAGWPRAGNVEALPETDGAYRDGVFWGQLDARQGRKVQPSIGRWNSERDRALFKSGYENGYREVLTSRNSARPRLEH